MYWATKMICSRCNTDLKLYVCPRHKKYVCFDCLTGITHEDGKNVEGMVLSKFVYRCLDEDCNFLPVRR